MHVRKRTFIFCQQFMFTLTVTHTVAVYFINAARIEFTVEPEDIIALRHTPAVLNCQAIYIDGHTRHTITSDYLSWLSDDGRAILYPGDTRSLLKNGSLYFNAISDDALGSYRCIARSDSVGAIVSRSAIVQLAALYNFEDEPRDNRVYPGQTAFFTCAVKANPRARVTWLKDERAFVLDETRMILLPSGALEIDDILPTDQGTYRCNVSIDDEFKLSGNAVLTLGEDLEEAALITPPTFIATPQSLTVREGDTVTLDCAAIGNSKPWITWLKDGVTIDMALLDSRFKKVGTGSLLITNVEESDSGTYQCRAENTVDSVDATGFIDVQVPPRFVKRPKDAREVIKKDIVFECEVYGKPTPKVHWLKNGEVIRTNDYWQLFDGTNLRILGLMVIDAGVFQCVAANPAGNVQAAAVLTIIGESSVLTDADRSTGLPSAPRNLTAVIINPRYVILSWSPPLYTNGDIIAYSVEYKELGSDRERTQRTKKPRLEEINISHLNPNRPYQFRVSAHNNKGVGVASPYLEITTKSEEYLPSMPRNVQAWPSAPRAIHVRWDAPEVTHGDILEYKLYYMDDVERSVTTQRTEYTITHLKNFTDYTIWLAAANRNGTSKITDEIVVRTLSDKPSAAPQNIHTEMIGSAKVAIKWEPPSAQHHNGIITGYKIRERKNNDKPRTYATDANAQHFELNNLDANATYQVRLQAFNINGTGPWSDWLTIGPLKNEILENMPPGQMDEPHLRCTSKSIVVSWNPPRNNTVRIRHYALSWGRTGPYDHFVKVDAKNRSYEIRNLDPGTEYIVSIHAENDAGVGEPSYGAIATKRVDEEEFVTVPVETQLIPPVALKTIVLSATTIVLSWEDSSLGKSQYVKDNRYYIVRYARVSSADKYINSSVLSCIIDDLRPFTQYEFSVKVVKGRRESDWSMLTSNVTFEAPPQSSPRDFLVVPHADDRRKAILTWLPPKLINGILTGYLIQYTSDLNVKEQDWIVTASLDVDTNRMVIANLDPSQTYYFRVQARNRAGTGPFSSVVSFSTALDAQERSWFGAVAVYMIVGALLLLVISLTILTVVVCCRKKDSDEFIERKKTTKPQNIKPPDLWIHHDQMELRNMDKGSREGDRSATNGSLNGDGGSSSITTSTLPRSVHNTHDYDTQSLDKRAYVPNYMVQSSTQPLAETAALLNTQLSTIVTPNGLLTSRPAYPRTQYTITRAHVTLDATEPSPYAVQHNVDAPVTYTGTGEPTSGVYSCLTQQQIAQLQQTTGNACKGPVVNPGVATVAVNALGHPLKSFSVPGPPPTSSMPNTPQHKPNVNVRAPSSSPYKPKSSLHLRTNPMSSISVGGATTDETTRLMYDEGTANKRVPSEDTKLLHHSTSTEELNQEMANLEGLMKDLNAITASEFEC